jgi:GntR family transcriptional regulator, arabinose operon transcriptional repressor
MAKRAGGRTKHAQVFEYVHSAILAGRYQVGQRIPSETQLSRRFSVTRVTVGKALRELEVAGFLDRRPGSGSYARLPDKSQRRLLALLVPNLGEGEIFEPICSSIASAVRSHQFTILWGQAGSETSAGKARQAEELCRQYIEQEVDGVFFSPLELMPGMEEVNQRITGLLDRAGIPVVLLDCDITKYPRRSRYDLVGIDNRRVGRILAEHLLEQGCRMIEFVYRPWSAATIAARIAGCLEALRQNGVAPREGWSHCGEAGDPEFVRQLVANGLPDAYICGNDYTAAQLMHNLLNLGIRVPEDVRITGVDDLKYASLLSVPLTTIHQPCRVIGAAAVETIIQRIAMPTMPARDILVDFDLVVRRSSKATPLSAKSPPATVSSREAS